ncbi:MAG: DUF1778 domain-containing protein [Planctomycetes bacterium]|nr:DUF1778 domain-containing protein [Planctomycetota bacterium]
MSPATDKNEARLSFRLRGELKQTIEQAAAELGQTISEFAVATLVREARDVIQQSQQTRLSNRDTLLKVLEDAAAQPNAALKAAAKRYKKRIR